MRKEALKYNKKAGDAGQMNGPNRSRPEKNKTIFCFSRPLWIKNKDKGINPIINALPTWPG